MANPARKLFGWDSKRFMSLPGHCRSYVPAVTLEIVYKPMI
jgi:hypothetical protein